jgi:hypothetical protein
MGIMDGVIPINGMTKEDKKPVIALHSTGTYRQTESKQERHTVAS